jgi:hypothetical protein
MSTGGLGIGKKAWMSKVRNENAAAELVAEGGSNMIAGPNRLRALLVTLGAVAVLVSEPSYAEDTDKMLALTPKGLTFEPIPEMPICATAATLHGDPRIGPFWTLLKLASGCRVPRHWHSANESLVVVSGQGKIAMKDGPSLPFVPGAYASLPSHHMHEASCVRECLLFTISDGAYDIHYVGANGEEITAEQAMKQVTRTVPKKTKK